MVVWKVPHPRVRDMLDVGFMSLLTFEVWKTYPTHDDTFDSLSVF